MKEGGIFILGEDYQDIYSEALFNIPDYRRKSYEELSGILLGKSLFYGDAYIEAFKKEGIRARQIVPQCEYLQLLWAKENRIKFPSEWSDHFILRGLSRRLFKLPFLSVEEKLLEITTEQIKKARPEIVWVFSGVPVTSDMINEWKRYCEKIVLWYSCPLSSGYPYSSYDAIFSCIEPLVVHFKSQGIKSFLIPHAFDRRILETIKPAANRKPKLIFAGTLGSFHWERTEFLDKLSRVVEIDYYGPGCDGIPLDSPLRNNYRGPVWGHSLYSIFAENLIAIHTNIGVAGNYPSAKRLFEATGMGVCLMTPFHKELSSLFKPDREIVAFHDFDDCVVKTRSLLNDPQRALEIGELGQKRTLLEHHYSNRIQLFISYIREQLGVSINPVA